MQRVEVQGGDSSGGPVSMTREGEFFSSEPYPCSACAMRISETRVHITPEMEAKGSSLPMAMTGQYSCTFQSPLAEREHMRIVEMTSQMSGLRTQLNNPHLCALNQEVGISVNLNTQEAWTKIMRRLIDVNQEVQGQASHVEHILEVAIRLCPTKLEGWLLFREMGTPWFAKMEKVT